VSSLQASNGRNTSCSTDGIGRRFKMLAFLGDSSNLPRSSSPQCLRPQKVCKTEPQETGMYRDETHWALRFNTLMSCTTLTEWRLRNPLTDLFSWCRHLLAQRMVLTSLSFLRHSRRSRASERPPVDHNQHRCIEGFSQAPP